MVDVVQELSPRSAFTAAGSFGVVHFTDTNPFNFINSNQVGGEVGYSHAISRRDQLGIIYGFRAFRYPPNQAESGIDSHVIQALFGHRISGRLDLVAGAGPQWTVILEPGGAGNPSTTHLSVSARFALSYRFPRTTTSLAYNRLDTTGSGFFAGAESDIVRAGMSREIARRWHASADVGFSHNVRLQTPALTQAQQVTSAGSFDYVFAGGGIKREFNRNLGAFLGYQFNTQTFSDCKPTAVPTTTSCATTSRQVVTFGVDWHFRPIRLD